MAAWRGQGGGGAFASASLRRPRTPRRLHSPGLVAVFLCALLAPSAVGAQVVKCVDAKGRVEYAKVCPPGTNAAGPIRLDATPDPAPTPSAAAPRPGTAKAPDVDPGLLNDAEDRVCTASVALARARSAQAAKGRAPADKSSSPPATSGDPKVDAFLDNMESSIVRDEIASQTKELARHQADYRRLTGTEFNVAYCNDNQRRYERQVAYDAARERKRNLNQFMANYESEGVKAICAERKAGAGAPSSGQDAARAGGAESEYDRLVAAYERVYQRKFDPARCR